MGNSSSSGRAHHEDTVDFGHLAPQGIYTGPRDWNQPIVTQLIIDRKLSPFYRPLEDYEDGWDDDQIPAAMKEPAQPDGADGDASITRAESIHSTTSRTHHKRPSAAAKEPVRHQETIVYRGSVECPICFLVRAALRLPPDCSLTRPPRRSTTPLISTAPAAATRPSAPSVSCRSSGPTRRRHTSSRSPPAVPTASAIILASSTRPRPGARASAARDPYVAPSHRAACR